MANILNFDMFSSEQMDPPYKNYNLTNRTLYKYSQLQTSKGPQKKKKNVIYYCAGYLRAKIKNFSQMNLSDLAASINVVLIFTLNLKGIGRSLQQEITKKLTMKFNRNQPIPLGEESQELSIRVEEEGIYTFTLRKILNTGIKAEIFLTPFQLINLILTVKLQKIHIQKSEILALTHKCKKLIQQKNQQLKQVVENKYTLTKQLENQLIQQTQQKQKQKQKQMLQLNKLEQQLSQDIQQLQKQMERLKKFKHVTIYINLMDFQGDRFAKISYSEKGTFGEYDIAELLMKVEYTNLDLARMIREEKKQKKKDHAKNMPFEFAHFQIPVYKFPFVNLLTIFIPLWLLGVLNLGVFFQDTSLADRIGSLSALMIAFVALIPVIRETLPPNPNITLVQILVYVETSTTLLCFIQSMRVREMQDYVFDWEKNVLFLICVSLGAVEIVIICILWLLYWTIWKQRYNLSGKNLSNIKFNYREWYNKDCDLHFKRKLDTQQIKILVFEQRLQLPPENNKKDKKQIFKPKQKKKLAQIKRQDKQDQRQILDQSMQQF